jgi:hypothetical protein
MMDDSEKKLLITIFDCIKTLSERLRRSSRERPVFLLKQYES